MARRPRLPPADDTRDARGAKLPFATAAASAAAAVVCTSTLYMTAALAASGVFIASVLVIAVRALREGPRPPEARALPEHTDREP